MENGSVAATKADLEALESRLTSLIAAQDERFQGRMDTLEQRMMDRVGHMIQDSETRLLQAFYGYAEATNKRLNQMDGNIAMPAS